MPDAPDAPDDPHGATPRRDFERMLDLNRSSLIRDLVGEMEARLREVESAQVAVKDVVEAAKRQEFTAKEAAMMKKIARLRLKDKGAEAAQELETLARMAKATGFPLFTWAGL